MRPLLLTLALGLMLTFCARGQDTPAAPLQKFEGNAPQTTPAFTVADKWEVRWNSYEKVNITIVATDGTPVAGAAGSQGALYLLKGGSYHLQIDSDPPPPEVLNKGTPQDGRSNGPTGFESTLNGGSSNQTPNNGSPSPNGHPGQYYGPTVPTYGDPRHWYWHVEVVEMGSAAAQVTWTGMVNFNIPPSATLASTPNTPPPSIVPVNTKLTEDQARAVVLIKGDNAEGTGFLIKTPDGPAVVTNLHVIANNPNLKITTNMGSLIKVLSMKGACDRDLARLTIQDAGYSYLEVEADISKTVQPGDEVITPGNSQGGEVMLNTGGKVLGIGPERIEIDNPIYHGNSGGPVFHPKTGKVLGVVTEAMKIDVSNDLDKASFASRNSAISGSMRYFGLRLDSVSSWVAIDSRSFQIETTFLDQFHEQSRRLDAFLNVSDKNQSGNNNSGDNSNSGNNAKIYLSDEKIMKANDNFVRRASGADTTERIEALRGFLFDLQCVADLNVDQIQNANNFYSFDRERAQDEFAYRKALKGELSSIGNNVERLGNLPRTNN